VPLPAKRYSPEVLQVPADVLDEWAERQRMIRSILRAGAATLGDRAVKHVLKREKDEFLKNARERQPQRKLDLEELLSVFTA
jgi:hypothetical protein